MWGHRIINLTFHGIGNPERRLEPGEQHIWLDSEHFEAILDSAVGQSDVRITFDDGNISDLEYALPALCQRGLSATFFLVAGRLGVPGFLDESDVRELAAAGMDIGNHGMHHRPWRRLDDRALREELVDAKEQLEGVIERPVTEAACPFGSYDSRVLRALQRHGYRRAYTSDRGTARPGNWIQARNTVRPADAASMVQRTLSERVSLYSAARRRVKLAGMRWP